MSSVTRTLVSIAALLLIGLSIYNLERPRHTIDISNLVFAGTPATRYQTIGSSGPMVIIAHGFAGSRQLMQAFSLTLAAAGYDVIAFDFEGHGRNPVPMSGDVTAIDGTTRLLVEETRRVMAAARNLSTNQQGIALLGHSMATDVILRAAALEAAAEPDDRIEIATIIGISMFSEVVNETSPKSLLIINGQWEARLRAPALEQLQMINPSANEGETASAGNVVRRVVVAPGVEHVSVLYSTTALQEVLDWMDDTFERRSETPIANTGGWILLLLASIVLLFKPVSQLLPASEHTMQPLSARDFWPAVLLPMLITPLLAFLPAIQFLPVLVADYLLLHLALYGTLQLLTMRSGIPRLTLNTVICAAVLCIWGIGIFGLALDRYAASFLPSAGRLTIIAVLCMGTIWFMISDAMISAAGNARWWQRVVARVALMLSLAAAALIDPERLVFLLLILPLLLLFYLVHGLLGRWIAQRSGALAAGLGLGICLAWALGVSFPMFDAS